MLTFSLLYTYINYVIQGSTNKMVSADLRPNLYTDDALQGVIDYKELTRLTVKSNYLPQRGMNEPLVTNSSGENKDSQITVIPKKAL